MKEIKILLQIAKENYICAAAYLMLNIFVTLIYNKEITLPLNVFSFTVFFIIFLLNLVIYKTISAKCLNVQFETIKFIKKYLFPVAILISIKFLLLGIMCIPLKTLEKLITHNFTIATIKLVLTTLYYYLISLSLPFLLCENINAGEAFIKSIITTFNQIKRLSTLILLFMLYFVSNIVFHFMPAHISFIITRDLISNFINFIILAYGLVKVNEMELEKTR